MDSFFYEYLSKLQVLEENKKMEHIFFTTHVKNIKSFLMDEKCMCEIDESGNKINAFFKLESQISGQVYKFSHSIFLTKYEKTEKDAINLIYFKSEKIISDIYQQIFELKKENQNLKEIIKSNEVPDIKKISLNLNKSNSLIVSLQKEKKLSTYFL